MDVTPPVSRYQQVADHLRAAIAAGEYQPGERLPSESSLATDFSLSRPTINKAIRQLMAEGLVTVEHGRGTTVRQRRPVLHVSSRYVIGGPDERAQWATEADRQGMSAHQEIRAVEVTSPPDDIGGFLGVSEDEQAVVRKRVMYTDNEPVQLADSYYPEKIAGGTELQQNGRIQGGTIGALERLGYTPGRFIERIETRMPSPDEERLLDMAQGTPVLRHIRVTYAEDGQPVEVDEHIMVGDRHVLTYDLPARME